MASDKLFYLIFHSAPDLILRWLQDLPADAGGYSFSAPVLKEREYRLDGLFSPRCGSSLSPGCSEPQVRNLANALRQRAAADPLGAYQEIFGLGEAKVTLRQLTRRCGPLTGTTTALIQARPTWLTGSLNTPAIHQRVGWLVGAGAKACHLVVPRPGAFCAPPAGATAEPASYNQRVSSQAPA